MIYVQTSLKASLWLALGYIFKIHKTAKLYKKCAAFKSLDEKGFEIKGGGHEMAALMLMIKSLNNGFVKIYYHQHHCSHFMATTFDFTTFFAQDF